MSALPRRSPRRAALTVVAVVAVLQSLMVLAFAWPATRTAPRDLPVVVAGPAAAAARLSAGLERAHPGALAVRQVPDATAAREAVRRRDAYGGVLLLPDGPRLLVATAAGPAVAQLLSSAVAELGAVRPAPVEDVVPAGPDDPRGGVLSAGLLPIVMTSVIAGAGLALLVSSAVWRAAGAAALAVLSGLAVPLIGHALGGLQGSYAAEGGVVALLVLAVSATVAGAGSLAGHGGIPPAAMVMMLLGNPLSGAASAPEMLPRPWGDLGQLLPPGAGAQALRSVGFFDGAAAGGPLLVLGAWAAAGLLLLAVAGARVGRSSTGATGPAGGGAGATGQASRVLDPAGAVGTAA